jgi:hypothetical protein
MKAKPSNQAPTINVELTAGRLARVIVGLETWAKKRRANFRRRKTRHKPGEAASMAMELSEVDIFIRDVLTPAFKEVNERDRAWVEEWRAYNEAKKAAEQATLQRARESRGQ